MLKQITVTQCNAWSNRVTSKLQLCINEVGKVSQRKKDSRKAEKSSPKVTGSGAACVKVWPVQGTQIHREEV